MDAVIKTENLSKHYGKLKAVDRICINVQKGEIYGFLGLNGAGKTTTIRMLLGLVIPTSGVSYLKGIKVSPGNSALWKDVGYLVEVPYSYPDLTVRDNLEIIRRLRLIRDQKSVDHIIEKLNLVPYRDVITKNLSLGNSQRLGLAKALIHNPDILLLDEPANGLDPAGIVEIRELLKDLALNKGVTIFTPVALITSISRGYLLPVGYVILTLMITQFVFVGFAVITPYFPWAIPALYSGSAGPDNPKPEFISYFILAVTTILGLFSTAAWWRFADQK